MIPKRIGGQIGKRAMDIFWKLNYDQMMADRAKHCMDTGGVLNGASFGHRTLLNLNLKAPQFVAVAKLSKAQAWLSCPRSRERPEFES